MLPVSGGAIIDTPHYRVCMVPCLYVVGIMVKLDLHV